MDKDLRASLVAACAAAALSALVGIIAGVGFFVLLLRALVGGLIFGALAYGGMALIKSALPGILNTDEASGRDYVLEPIAAPDLGSRVDIVLPGEPAQPDAAMPNADAAEDSIAEPFAARHANESPEEAAYIDEPSLLEPEGQAGEGEAAIPANAGPEGDRRGYAGFDELDVLPDMDGFTDSFSASEFASGGSTAERQDRAPAGISGGGSSSARSGQEGLDPAALAQAVRTILKRDQKG